MTTDHIDPQAIADLAATLTWEPPDPGEWEYDSTHQTEPVSASLAALGLPTFKAGFQAAFAPFGLPLSHMEMRLVNGYGYMSAFVHGAPRKSSGKPPPGFVIKALSRIPPSARRRTKLAAAALENDHAMQEVDRWDGLREGWIERCLELQDVDLANCADDEVADHVRRTASLFADGYRLHFELIGQAIPVGEYMLATEAWGIDSKDAAKAAFHGVRTTEQAHQRLDILVAALGQAEVSSLDAVRQHSSEASAALDEYLRHHGTWLLADDVQNPTVEEHSGVVLGVILQHREGGPDEQVEIDAALAACRDAVDPSEHAALDKAITRAQRAYAAMDDNSGLLAAWPGGLVHRSQVEASRRLVEHDVLTSATEVWSLSPDEIANLLEGSSSPSRDEIDRRILLRAAQASLTPPDHLGSPPGPPPDAGLFPAPVAHYVRVFGAFMAAKFGGPRQAAIGLGDQPATGRAVVAHTPGDALERIEPGDILVTSYTTPAYNVVMPMLGGVVTTTGGASCHTAVVARELGISAVVGLTDAFVRIRDGATVTVDPDAATVTVTE